MTEIVNATRFILRGLSPELLQEKSVRYKFYALTAGAMRA